LIFAQASPEFTNFKPNKEFESLKIIVLSKSNVFIYKNGFSVTRI